MAGANHTKVAGVALTMAMGALLVVASCSGSSDANTSSNTTGFSGSSSGGSSSSSGGGPEGGTPGIRLGDDYSGIFNYGPVDWAETEWHNGCAGDDGYPPEIETMDGNLLGGVSNEVGGELFCDACAEITSANGRKLVVRIVTYGVVYSPGDMDLSPQAYDALYTNENSRNMTWHVATCPGTDPIYFQFQVGSNTGWSRLWIRNPRVAIAKVEVQSKNHPNFTALKRESDGAFVDYQGFGNGSFTLRVTGVDGNTLDQSFDSYPAGQLIKGSTNLQ